MMHVMKHKTISLAAAAALALGSASAAHAEIGFKAGAWDLSFSGNVNGFATWNTCDNTANVVAGGLACSKPANGGVNEQKIESGLLPSALVFSAKSRQSGLDIGVTIGFYPGLNGLGGKTGLDTSAIDLRQNFLTFGDKSWGTIKVGKDIGLFGSDAILADMTLLGVGSGAAFLGGNTTLGRIGVGYIYTDWIPQITYSSPSYGGFSFAGGVFQGVNIVQAGLAPNSAELSGHEEPGFQGKASYEWKGSVSGKAWVSGIGQKVKARSGLPDTPGLLSGANVSGTGFDIGAKVNWGALEGVLYAYSADGIGTTAIGFNAASFNGVTLEKRKSDGWYAQATYKIGAFKPGVSYGESHLKLAGNESGNTTLVKTNKSTVFGLYYSLTPSVNLVAEYIPTEAENQGGGTVKDKVLALGAIMFF